MYKVTINLESDLDQNDLVALLTKMLWDSEFSYDIENATWIIKE